MSDAERMARIARRADKVTSPGQPLAWYVMDEEIAEDFLWLLQRVRDLEQEVERLAAGVTDDRSPPSENTTRSQ